MNQPTDEQVREDFRRHLVASGRDTETAAEVAAAINLDGFSDEAGNVNTQKLHEFAARFHISAGRRRDWGGGQDTDHRSQRPVGPGRLEAERRFGKGESGATDRGGQGQSFRSAEARRRFGGDA